MALAKWRDLVKKLKIQKIKIEFFYESRTKRGKAKKEIDERGPSTTAMGVRRSVNGRSFTLFFFFHMAQPSGSGWLNLNELPDWGCP